MTQVYAVLHDPDGKFLIADKHLAGYFFARRLTYDKTSTTMTATGETVVPPQELKGNDKADQVNGRRAFPGGGLKGADKTIMRTWLLEAMTALGGSAGALGTAYPTLTDEVGRTLPEDEPAAFGGAAREFWEETGVWIPADARVRVRPLVVVADDPRLSYRFAYFMVGGGVLVDMAARAVERHFPADKAAREYVAGTAGAQYTEVRRRFPLAPVDDELADATVWDLAQDATKDIVRGWRDNRHKGWYAHALRNLAQQLGIPGYDD